MKKPKKHKQEPKKIRAATYIDRELWNRIENEAEHELTTGSHIMRVLLSEALDARESRGNQ